MAKVISQETFDDVVKENIVEFSMSSDEAKKETIDQFEAQGINLANIIKDLSINEESGRPVLSETIEQLRDISKQTKAGDDEETIRLLDVLANECAKSIPHRVVRMRVLCRRRFFLSCFLLIGWINCRWRLIVEHWTSCLSFWKILSRRKALSIHLYDKQKIMVFMLFA